MGCFGSKEETADGSRGPNFNDDVVTVTGGKIVREKPTTNYKKPQWKSDEPITLEQIKARREEFWDTQPHYGGSREIWDALKGACEAEDIDTAKLIIESAGIIVVAHDMTVCYDERGAKYELPKYVISNPINMEVAA